eukprot:1283782-Ditylum_brightwellii.AAC.1
MLQHAPKQYPAYFCLRKQNEWVKSAATTSLNNSTASPDLVSSTNVPLPATKSINAIVWYDDKKKTIDDLSEPAQELI